MAQKQKQTSRGGQAKRKKSRPKSAHDILKSSQFKDLLDKKKYVKHEYQDFGIRLAYKLNDIKHKSLYIKLAKTEDRGTLEAAYRFAVDYPKMEDKNRGRLFMWKLKKLREEQRHSHG